MTEKKQGERDPDAPLAFARAFSRYPMRFAFENPRT